MTYTAPSITVLGSVRDLTLAGPGNKVGFTADQFTAITNGAIVGSIVDPIRP